MAIPALYKWQQTRVDTVMDLFKTNPEVVLAVCPSGGKTVMGSHISQQFKTVVILAHGTNVIKNQWTGDAENPEGKFFQWGVPYGPGTNLFVALPQGSEKLYEQLGDRKVDLLIVDEAHEYYHKGMVQAIIQKLRPTHTLLLTGTPSRFVLDNQSGTANRPLVVISGKEVYEDHKRLHNAHIVLVRSTYSYDGSDDGLDHDEESANGEGREGCYNTANDLKQSVTLQAEDTESSLGAFIKEAVRNMALPSGIKKRPSLSNAIKWPTVFKKLDKTLIASHNIRQAQDIHACLLRHGVNVVISESETDEDSGQFKAFLQNKEVRVLIVVRRGILGFDMPELVNVVDMTMTRNINRIYQLYARVLRTLPGSEKFYYKLASKYNYPADRFYLAAALHMNHAEFMVRFNGKNLRFMNIMTPRSWSQKEAVEGESSESEECSPERRQGKPLPIDSEMFELIMSCPLLDESRIRSAETLWDEWATCQFGKAMERLTGIQFRQDWEVSLERCKAFYAQHGQTPSAKSENKEERSLGKFLVNACAKGTPSKPNRNYRPKVREWRDGLRAENPLSQDWEVSLEGCKAFYAQHGQTPSAKSENKEERILGKFLVNACVKGTPSKPNRLYRPKVREWRDGIRAKK